MTCPECDREIYKAACVCGYRPQVIKLNAPQLVKTLYGGVDRDSFGRGLYDAIKFCTAIQMVRTELEGEHVQTRPAWKRVLEEKETVLLKELDALLPTLSADEQDQLLAKYQGVIERGEGHEV